MNPNQSVHVLLGDQYYQVERNWAAAAYESKGICDISVLTDGRIVVLRRHHPQFSLLSPQGELLEHWSVPSLISAHYMQPRTNGGLLVADLCSHTVIGLNHKGELILELGQRGTPKWGQPFNNPTAAIEDTQGRIYVTDGYGNACLHGFNADGSHQFTIGKRGSEPGEFSTPHAIVISNKGELFVGDRENSRIQVFDTQGNWLRQFSNMYKPMAIALLGDDQLLVSDQTPALSLFSTAGELLGRCRTYGVYGHGVAVDQHGAIYIAEMAPDSITKLSPISL